MENTPENKETYVDEETLETDNTPAENEQPPKKKRKFSLPVFLICSIIAIINIIYAGNMDFEIERILANKGLLNPEYIECTTNNLPYSVDSEEVEKQYVEKYVEVTGLYAGGGEGFIGLEAVTGDAAFPHVWCSYTNDEQKKVVSTLTEGDKVVVKGLITYISRGTHIDMHDIKLVEKGSGKDNW